MSKESDSIDTIRRQRSRIALFAWAYEVKDDSLVDDYTYDTLSETVHSNKDIETGDHVYDTFFSTKFDKDTGMWIMDHPDIGNGKLSGLYRYYKDLSRDHRTLKSNK